MQPMTPIKNCGLLRLRFPVAPLADGLLLRQIAHRAGVQQHDVGLRSSSTIA